MTSNYAKIYDSLYIEAVLNAECADLNDNKLTPIIFSHGLTGNNYNYSGCHRELASHGYIIFSIDHLDGSCNYTRDGADKEFTFDDEPNLLDHKVRKDQLKTRVEEI